MMVHELFLMTDSLGAVRGSQQYLVCNSDAFSWPVIGFKRESPSPRSHAHP
jgi:hypothetical protein